MKIEPTTATVEVTRERQFTATALDQFDNPIPGLTFVFRSEPEAGQIDGDGRFTAAMQTGTYESAVTVEVTQETFTKSASAGVTIKPGPLDRVVVSPSKVKAVPGQQQQFGASTFYAFGNEIKELQISWETGGAGTIDAQGIFTAGSVPGRYLKDINATAVENGREVIDTASVDIAFSGFGTATIDGQISPEEWDNATRLDFTFNIQGGDVPATLLVMNDEVSLYLSVRLPEGYGYVSFQFDGNPDGFWGDGDDIIYMSALFPDILRDYFRTTRPPCDAGYVCNFGDVNVGGTTDGVGKLAIQGGASTCMSYPTPWTARTTNTISTSLLGIPSGFSLQLQMVNSLRTDSWKS